MRSSKITPKLQPQSLPSQNNVPRAGLNGDPLVLATGRSLSAMRVRLTGIRRARQECYQEFRRLQKPGFQNGADSLRELQGLLAEMQRLGREERKALHRILDLELELEAGLEASTE